MLQRCALLLIFALTVASGCADLANPPVLARVEALPGGGTRVSNPQVESWPGGESWRLVPDLTIGEVDGRAEYVFASISGLEVGDDGRIYVLDRESNELRIFGPDGRHNRTVGRSGRGPGEYLAANALHRFAPDSLVVIDQQGARYSILSIEGDFGRAVDRPFDYFTWSADDAVVIGRRIFEPSFSGDVPTLVGVDLSFAAHDLAAGRELEPRGNLSRDRQSPIDTIRLPRYTGPPIDRFTFRTERGGGSLTVPFQGVPVRGSIDETGYWSGVSSEFRVTRTTLGGDTVLEVVLDVTAEPVTTADIDAWEGSTGIDPWRERGGVIDYARIPTTKPFFDGIFQDPEGFLWVARVAEPLRTRFAIFDPGGTYLGDVEVSGFMRDVSVQPVLTNERLYVVGTDELDVQRVYVFRVERG